jgi:hypothetical protein
MKTEQIVEILNSLNTDNKIPDEKIQEIAKSLEEHYDENGDPKIQETIEVLKDKMENEFDWRKKAALQAKIISLGFE